MSIETEAGTGHPPIEPSEEHGEEGHAHLPPPSIWPVTSAGGVALTGLGLVTTWPFWVAGLILTSFGITSWIQELRHEPHP